MNVRAKIQTIEINEIKTVCKNNRPFLLIIFGGFVPLLYRTTEILTGKGGTWGARITRRVWRPPQKLLISISLQQTRHIYFQQLDTYDKYERALKYAKNKTVREHLLFKNANKLVTKNTAVLK